MTYDHKNWSKLTPYKTTVFETLIVYVGYNYTKSFKELPTKPQFEFSIKR